MYAFYRHPRGQLLPLNSTAQEYRHSPPLPALGRPAHKGLLHTITLALQGGESQFPPLGSPTYHIGWLPDKHDPGLAGMFKRQHGMAAAPWTYLLPDR